MLDKILKPESQLNVSWAFKHGVSLYAREEMSGAIFELFSLLNPLTERTLTGSRIYIYGCYRGFERGFPTVLAAIRVSDHKS